ncbi:MAG: hypothetical protein ACK4WM_05275 [Thermoflexales bacterium]
MKARVTASLLNVRSQPSVLSPNNVIGLLSEGQEVEVLSIENGWARVSLQAGGASLRSVTSGKPATAFVFAQYLEFVQRPRFKIGLHTMSNGGLAKQEAAHGCEFFLCMDDFETAGEIARNYPNAVVMARHFFVHGMLPSVEQIIDGLGGAKFPRVIYIGLNEADQVGQDGDDLRRRAMLDIEVAKRIRQISGATYAAGTFSMGCPDFTNPETVQIIREIYAPAYNSGLIAFDMHPYAPNPAHINQPNEWQWFERRWEFLFTRCGFDPTIRAIYFSECGLDQTGVGGFKAHRFTPAQFRDWIRQYIAIQEATLVVDSKEYPSPVIGGALFQYGGNGDPRWEGYDVSEYIPVLREFYTGASSSTNQPIAASEKVSKRRSPTQASAALKTSERAATSKAASRTASEHSSRSKRARKEPAAISPALG